MIENPLKHPCLRGFFKLAYWLIDIDDFASPDSIALCQKELPL
ncbi:conserved hypothetical protein [Vibrio parahaemolyticus AQ4037]|nr:conserved hypothetical protein [Vibrio parahaemolyticus AQ4037]